MSNRKPNRNDPCPCASGEKFKKCCLGKKAKHKSVCHDPNKARLALNKLQQLAMIGRQFNKF